MTNAVGVDVGGTAMKAVLVDPAGTVLDERSVATPRPDPGGRLTADAIAAAVAGLSRGERTAVGITAPGLVDEARGVVVDSVNLGWHDVPIRDLVEERLGIPVGFGHDVRAGGLAEIHALSDAGPDTVTVFVPIGTGLAAAIFVGRRVLAGCGGAGEIGQIVFPSGPHAGKRLEEVASASAVARRVGTSGAADVARLVEAGDPFAAEVWDDTAAALAFALAALIAVLAPNTVILGGGLAESGELLFTPTRRWLERLLPGVPLPPFRAATHGRLAGALGAAILGRARLETSGIGQAASTD
jgi:glucokinase